MSQQYTLCINTSEQIKSKSCENHEVADTGIKTMTLKNKLQKPFSKVIIKTWFYLFTSKSVV